MSALLLDDSFGEHPKIVVLSDAAFRAHVRAMLWAKKHRTGGVIRLGAQFHLAPKRTKDVVAELERGALWEPHEDGWRIHDWEDWWNEDEEQAAEAKEVLAERRRETARSRSARIAGQKSAEARRQRSGSAQPRRTSSNDSPNGAPNGALERPERNSRTEPSNVPNALVRASVRAHGRAHFRSLSRSGRNPSCYVVAKGPDRFSRARARTRERRRRQSLGRLGRAGDDLPD